MFCSSCAHKNVDEAKFCAKCGASLRPQPEASPIPLSHQPETAAAVSNGMKWGIAAGTIILPILGIIMGIIYLRDANLEKKAAGKLWLWIGIVMGILNLIAIMES